MGFVRYSNLFRDSKYFQLPCNYCRNRIGRDRHTHWLIPSSLKSNPVANRLALRAQLRGGKLPRSSRRYRQWPERHNSNQAICFSFLAPCEEARELVNSTLAKNISGPFLLTAVLRRFTTEPLRVDGPDLGALHLLPHAFHRPGALSFCS